MTCRLEEPGVGSPNVFDAADAEEVNDTSTTNATASGALSPSSPGATDLDEVADDPDAGFNTNHPIHFSPASSLSPAPTGRGSPGPSTQAHMATRSTSKAAKAQVSTTKGKGKATVGRSVVPAWSFPDMKEEMGWWTDSRDALFEKKD